MAVSFEMRLGIVAVDDSRQPKCCGAFCKTHAAEPEAHLPGDREGPGQDRDQQRISSVGQLSRHGYCGTL